MVGHQDLRILSLKIVGKRRVVVEDVAATQQWLAPDAATRRSKSAISLCEGVLGGDVAGDKSLARVKPRR